jgi:hypothetical protein
MLADVALGLGRVKTVWERDEVAFANGARFSGQFALIAATSGWMPMMFMTRVRL